MKSSPDKEPSFEAALEKLENLVTKLETGETPLEEMIARFEDGHRLLGLCTRKLQTAEQRIEVLKQERKGITLASLETDTP